MKSFETICKELNKENDEIFEKVCEILDERLDDAVGQYGCDLHKIGRASCRERVYVLV